MLSSLLGSSSEIIQISEDDVKKIMENVIHGPLKCSTYVLESKRHDMISKGTPWGSKSGFILIYWMDLDLIVDGEPIHEGKSLIHEGKSLVSGTVIDNLVDERGWKVVLGTRMVQITKVNADTNSALFFVNRDGVGNP
jgi:hypothetical protein